MKRITELVKEVKQLYTQDTEDKDDISSKLNLMIDNFTSHACNRSRTEMVPRSKDIIKYLRQVVEGKDEITSTR